MNGQVQEYSKAHRMAYFGHYEALGEFRATYGDYITKMCKQVDYSKYRKGKNIRDRFEWITETGNTLFLTLTFSDETLASTSEETRRKYVRRFLKEQCLNYVANIDFGDKKKNPNSNEREHYHALCLSKDPKNRIDLNAWVYGYSYVRRVKSNGKDNTKVSKYVAKLCNHSLKESGRLVRLIWSRGWREWKHKTHTEMLEDRFLPF